MHLDFRIEEKDLKKAIKYLSGFFILFAVITILRNAWVSDDAYISFRTVFNFTEGYGLRYNLDERVQSFTNPAWLFLVSIFYFFTGEAYFTSIFLSLAVTLPALYLLSFRIARGSIWPIASILILTVSLHTGLPKKLI